MIRTIDLLTIIARSVLTETKSVSFCSVSFPTGHGLSVSLSWTNKPLINSLGRGGYPPYGKLRMTILALPLWIAPRLSLVWGDPKLKNAKRSCNKTREGFATGRVAQKENVGTYSTFLFMAAYCRSFAIEPRLRLWTLRQRSKYRNMNNNKADSTHETNTSLTPYG